MKTDPKISKIYFDVVSKINEIRNLIKSEVSGIFKEDDYILLTEELSSFKHLETVKIFLDDCEKCRGGLLDFSNTRDFVFTKKEPLVLSFFNAPYNLEYGLDAFVYKVEEPDEYFLEKFKSSMATSITILERTLGFDQYPTCVALFPENFCSQESFKNNFSVFYFVDVFERRFQEYGKPTLNQFTNQNSFWRLKRLTKETRQKAFATWHYLHEYHHSSGSLPLINHLKLKSKRRTAAIEESRVDVLSILECFRSISEGFPDGILYAELILFERLISYSVHLDPQTNYDARASHILFDFLKSDGIIDVNDLVLNFDRKRIKDSLEKYVNAINKIEEEIKIALEGSNNDLIENSIQKLHNFADQNKKTQVVLKNEFFKNAQEKIKFNPVNY